MIIESDKFRKMFADAGIEITDEQMYRLGMYSELLVQWNEKINLTAITDPEGISVKHFFDSIYPFSLIDLPKGCRFASRCSKCTPRCLESEPELVDMGNGHKVACFLVTGK